MTIALWIFPPEDFPAWCEMVGSPQVGAYSEYLTLLAATQADVERQGLETSRVRMTVAEMREALAAAGLENTPDSRARIIAERRNLTDGSA